MSIRHSFDTAVDIMQWKYYFNHIKLGKKGIYRKILELQETNKIQNAMTWSNLRILKKKKEIGYLSNDDFFIKLTEYVVDKNNRDDFFKTYKHITE